jgi:hypothetical protein
MFKYYPFGSCVQSCSSDLVISIGGLLKCFCEEMKGINSG